MSDTKESSPRFASVILDDAIDQSLDYLIPPHLERLASPGIRVKVHVRNSERSGTILSIKSSTEISKVQSILELISETPFIAPDLFQLAEWMAKYYACSLRKVLKSILPPSIRGKVQYKEQLFVKSTLSQNALVTLCENLRNSYPLQAQIIDVLLKNPKGILLSELIEKSQTSRSPISTLIKKKVLLCHKIQIERSPLQTQEYFPTKSKRLNQEQQDALDAIQKDLSSAKFSPRLLYGVTGSGKTEVYLQAIEYALKLGKGVIFLVPEIALTSQTIEHLRSRFKEKLALLHHRLSDGERHDAWHQIRDGKIPIVIGARSSIFAPIPNLGLIIVDEEQESSYKQGEESPSYHARDVALMRAKLSGATIILGSATPSLETYHNALSSKYALNVLKQRADHALLPTVHIVDMKIECDKNKGFTLFSEKLIDGIKKRVAIGEQTILFLNRRGYHTSQMCTRCAHVIQCPNCDVSLTFHLSDNLLACHLCDYRLNAIPRCCPKCHAEGDLKFKGVGTELVEKTLHALFPEVRTLRLDADTTRHKGSHELLFKQFRAGKADVLIGTQMIAKGLHFPAVTLVGIINIDSTLQVPDFRASENVFQLITQVAGRSGRASIPGEVIIQTKMVDHPIIQLAARQQFEAFYSQEIEIRKLFSYPPFSYLIKCVLSGSDKGATLKEAHHLRETLIQRFPPSSEFLPVIPCGHAKINNQFRFQFLIKSEKRIGGQLTQDLRDHYRRQREFRLFIDIDPLSTY